MEPWGGMRALGLHRMPLDVAADGSFWLNGSAPTDEGCGGVAHYDGTTWTSYLVEYCIHDLAIAPDGSVWLGAMTATPTGTTRSTSTSSPPRPWRPRAVRERRDMMRKMRSALVVAISLALLGGLGGVAAAQQPAAQATDGWAIVTGTQSSPDRRRRLLLGREEPEHERPRLEGDVCIAVEVDEGGDGLTTMWSSITITNADGSWRGHSVGFMDEQEAHHHTSWFEGDGAYEGLAFIQRLTEANPEFPSAGGNLDFVGLIYRGRAPADGHPGLGCRLGRGRRVARIDIELLVWPRRPPSRRGFAVLDVSKPRRRARPDAGLP